MKQESYKKRPRSPKAYQLTSDRLSTQNNSICSHYSDSSSSNESFCLQMKVQAKYLIPSTLHLSICLQIQNLNSSYTRTKPSSCDPELTHVLL